jgi:titin
LVVNRFAGLAGILITSSGNIVEGNFIGVDLSGASARSNGAYGIVVEDGSNNTIGGTIPQARNLISGNLSDGVLVVQVDGVAENNLITGNFIGTDVNGSVDLGNALVGVEIEAGPNNTIGGTQAGAGNVISGNDEFGVLLDTTSGCLVQGNHLGTDATGTIGLGNGRHGAFIGNDPQRPPAAGMNLVGGTTPAARNIISANGQFGIRAADASNDNLIQGNFIGTNTNGDSGLGNFLDGVVIDGASRTTVGGSGNNAGNLISGNGEAGVLVFAQVGVADSNVISGNLIGTDVTGMSALPNNRGIFVAATNTRIGGTDPSAGNLISGNLLEGIFVRTLPSQVSPPASGNVVQGNRIGTDLGGSADLGNGLSGVLIMSGVDNQIGGTETGSGNVISGNDGPGVGIASATDVPFSAIQNSVRGNRIHSNGSLGIDLGEPDGVTPNDPGDADVGANGLQNFPLLTVADATPSNLDIEGSLNGASNTTFQIDFFANDACDTSGHGEGKHFIGLTDATTNSAGIANFSGLLSVAVSDGDSITATATDELGNTSEFSACFPASCSAFAVFADSLMAPDPDTLAWGTPADVHAVKGDLAIVASYVPISVTTLLGATSLDTSLDVPAFDTGLYYLVRPHGCSSWQTMMGEEPARDLVLP